MLTISYISFGAGRSSCYHWLTGWALEKSYKLFCIQSCPAKWWWQQTGTWEADEGLFKVLIIVYRISEVRGGLSWNRGAISIFNFLIIFNYFKFSINIFNLLPQEKGSLINCKKKNPKPWNTKWGHEDISSSCLVIFLQITSPKKKKNTFSRSQVLCLRESTHHGSLEAACLPQS